MLRRQRRLLYRFVRLGVPVAVVIRFLCDEADKRGVRPVRLVKRRAQLVALGAQALNGRCGVGVRLATSPRLRPGRLFGKRCQEPRHDGAEETAAERHEAQDAEQALR